MKMVKSLLLGTAAGLVAIAGAQAADLPVKAKPVQYVKICSLYGAGFFYIPGTDTCIKLGGWMRWEIDGGGNTNSFAQLINGGGGRYNLAEHRATNQRARAVLSFDVRSQTAYGTLRAYIRGGWQWSSGDEYTSSPQSAYYDRGFIQFAGFTFGKAVSFFDIYGPYNHSYITNFVGSATGGSGLMVAGYTAQFGNGFSASLALEDRGGKGLFNASTRTAGAVAGTFVAPLAIGTTPGFGAGGAGGSVAQTNPFQEGGTFSPVYPDIVGNLRVDQAWGSAGISGALHYVSASYYVPTSSVSGRPGSRIGGAAGIGALINLPWAKGDTFGFEVDWASGAGQYTNYSLDTNGGVNLWNANRTGAAIGWNPEAVFLTGGGLHLTNSWGVTAGINHFWIPTVQTSLHGGYLNVLPSTDICASFPGTTSAGIVAAGCKPRWDMWYIGSRTIWNPVPNLDLGLEVMYTRVDTSFAGGVAPATGSMPATVIAGNDVFGAIFRVQRNFWP
jgi:hypothetical protein